MTRTRIVRLGIAVVGLLAVAAGAFVRTRDAADPIEAAAAAFLGALTPEHRELANLPFDDPNRLDWHYIPRERRGLALKDMTDAERLAAHGLLRAALSSRGYLKATSIMELDQVLREAAEARGQRADHRDGLLYFFTVFGDPSPPTPDAAPSPGRDPASGSAPWGWRIEGHHLSLNFSSVTGEVAVTPAFLGANPAEVRAGRRAGLRVLAPEEDLARELLGSLDGGQRARAVLESDVPADILMSPGNDAGALGDGAGLPVADMTERQRSLVSMLVGEWAGNLRPELAAHQLERIEGAGIEHVRFLWIGAPEPGRPHYYRLRGPTFVIEYDNTQDGANHIHTVWRDPEHDFGGNLLREHLLEDHR